jgi:calcineurin-like phosphoesterase family protein
MRSTLKKWSSMLTLGLMASACAEQPFTPSPSPSQTEASITAVTFIGAGDIAGCALQYGDEATAELIRDIDGTVFTLGDNVYRFGTPGQFNRCYDPSWGQFKARTRPAPGNHDYLTEGAAGYFGYFGARAGPCCRGYYTYRLGNWRIYSLNSETDRSTQLAWLKNHLANHPAQCVLAYWHWPLYSTGFIGSSTRMYGAFKALYQAGAELVLSGHDHNYQRFAPMDADGNRRSAGVREFVVGTGGAPNLSDFPNSAPNLQKRYKGWGVLKLTLSEGAYQWEFISVSDGVVDSGSGTCH